MQDKKLNDSYDAEYQMDVSVRAVTDGDLNDELPMEVEQDWKEIILYDYFRANFHSQSQ